MKISKIIMLRYALTSAALLSLFACGHPEDQEVSLQSSSTLAESEQQNQVRESTDGEFVVETYRGFDPKNNDVCELKLKKDRDGNTNSVRYQSFGCRDCILSFEAGGDEKPNFTQAPSFQFPGYTRLATAQGVWWFSFYPQIYDVLLLTKDNFKTIKAVNRFVASFVLPIPIPMFWTSDCIDVEKVDERVESSTSEEAI